MAAKYVLTLQNWLPTQEPANFLRIDWRGKEVALRHFTAKLLQFSDLVFLFRALRYDLQPQAVS